MGAAYDLSCGQAYSLGSEIYGECVQIQEELLCHVPEHQLHARLVLAEGQIQAGQTRAAEQNVGEDCPEADQCSHRKAGLGHKERHDKHSESASRHPRPNSFSISQIMHSLAYCRILSMAFEVSK